MHNSRRVQRDLRHMQNDQDYDTIGNETAPILQQSCSVFELEIFVIGTGIFERESA